MSLRILNYLLFIALNCSILLLPGCQKKPAPPIQIDTQSLKPAPKMSAQAEAGRVLFRQNCATCHAVHKDITGPKLGGAVQRAPGGRDWVYKFVRYPMELISGGDDYAVAIFDQYDNIEMTGFPQLSDEQIDNIFAYVDYEMALKEAK